jgi:tetratricopeptide (TPR) repeat protein
MKEARRLAEYVPHEVAAARIERQWSTVADRVQPRGARRPWAWLFALSTGAAAIAAIAIVYLAWPARTPEPAADPIFASATLEGGEDATRVSLRDGTKIELSAHGRLDMESRDASASRVRVARGRARFDVPHRRGRSFVVRARDVEVVVIGTRFSVAVEGDDVAVAVDRGVVEVRRAGRPPVRLRAGEELRVAREVATAEVEAEPRPNRPRRPARRASEEDLWDRATQARRAGRAEEAADAYAAFVRAHPRGSQAALASFELGRLRMDRLGDVGGAIEAFSRALRLSPSAPFAEDARARLVQANERAGRTGECRRLRAAYLDRYPNGVHRALVERRCPP